MLPSALKLWNLYKSGKEIFWARWGIDDQNRVNKQNLHTLKYRGIYLSMGLPLVYEFLSYTWFVRNWRLAKLNFLCFRLLEIEFSCLEILKQKSILLDHTVTEDASLIIDNLCFHLMEFCVEKNQLMRVCFSFKRSHSYK